MKKAISLLSVAFALAPYANAAQETPENWKCKWCPYEDESGWRGDVRFGLGYVDGEDYGFGNYRGWEDDGAYLVGDLQLNYRDEDGYYWKNQVHNLGFDARRLSSKGGKQGSYQLLASYIQTPRLYNNSSSTPFNGVGSDQLQLPDNWVGGDTAFDLTELNPSLKPIAYDVERKTTNLAASFNASRNLEFYIDFQNDEKSGLKATGLSYGNSSAFASTGIVVPMPIEQSTNQVDTGFAYQSKEGNWQVKAGYYLSSFSNDYDSVNWQNPFTDPLSDDAQGQASQSPDNQFHQLHLSSSLRLMDRTYASMYVAAGRASQDSSLGHYSINPQFADIDTPVNQVDAEVDTINWKLALHSQINSRWRVNARYQFNDRDNQTSRYLFNYVIQDSISSLVSRANTPYSFAQSKLELDSQYRLSSKLRLAAGVDYDERERTYQSVDTTEELGMWLSARYRLNSQWNLKGKYRYSERDGDDYQAVSYLSPEENPNLRKFNLANQEASQLDASVEFLPTENLALNLITQYKLEDYPDTVIGLQERESTTVTLDGNWAASELLNLYAFYTREEYTDEQSGSQTYPEPDWYNSSEDTIDSVGFGLSSTPLEDELTIGLDYLYSRADESHSLTSELLDLSLENLPDAYNKLHHVKFYTDYTMTEQWSLRLDVIYEKFEQVDFAYDDIEPDTLFDFIGSGQDSEDYDNSLIMISTQYQLR